MLNLIFVICLSLWDCSSISKLSVESFCLPPHTLLSKLTDKALCSHDTPSFFSSPAESLFTRSSFTDRDPSVCDSFPVSHTLTGSISFEASDEFLLTLDHRWFIVKLEKQIRHLNNSFSTHLRDVISELSCSLSIWSSQEGA